MVPAIIVIGVQDVWTSEVMLTPGPAVQWGTHGCATHIPHKHNDMLALAAPLTNIVLANGVVGCREGRVEEGK